MQLKNKKVIVTGGAGGIGTEIAKKLLEQGSVVAIVDFNEDRLERFSESVPENSRHMLELYNTDVSIFSDVKKMVDAFYEKHGEIDALVNNAAILDDSLLIKVFKGEIIKCDLKDWQKTIDTNLSSYFFFAREVAEKMLLRRTEGVIVNVSSISSSGNAGQTSYSASKAAVDALTVTWAQELANLKIRVAGVAPGMTDTQMPQNSMKASVLEDWINKTPMNRMAHSSEIADGVLFVLKNDFVCGRVIQIDGGLRM